MAYLSDENINELKDPKLINKSIFITRGKSKMSYTLHEPKSNGQKGLVWLGKDDSGNDVAIKIIPAEKFDGRNG